MAIRQIRDAKDVNTGELIYFTGHAGATYTNSGATVEEVLGATLRLGNSYYFNDSYENPYIKFTHIKDSITTNWFINIYNDSMWLGKLNNEVQIDSVGNFNATAFYQTSDATKKNIIDNVYVSLRDIANAPSVKFTWKNVNSDTQVGTVALYWKDVLPEVVRGTEGTYSVDYGVLATINSISLAKIIEKQEKRISELEVELENIKTFLQKQNENF